VAGEPQEYPETASVLCWMHDEDAPLLTPETTPEWAREALALLEQNASHPVRQFYEAYGVTWCEDLDFAFARIAPRARVFMFMSGGDSAYVWTKDGAWYLSPWFPYGPGDGRTIENVDSLP
jgi:hypothetical protein